jgi:hypothetical protein
MKAEPISKFIAYEPMLKPLSKTVGGGMRLTLEIPESEWEKVISLTNPALRNTTLKVTIEEDNNQ